jgi:hypothetical protein
VGALCGRRPRRRRPVVVALTGALAAALTCLLPGAASAQPASTRPSPTPSPSASAAPAPEASDNESEPTPEQLAAQARADDLRRRLDQQTTQADAARAALADVAQQAADALEAYRNAVQEQQQAQLDEAAAQARLEQAMQDVATQRSALGRWAWQAYVSGTGLDQSPAMVTVLTGTSTDDLAVVRTLTQSVGDGQAQALADLRAAQSRQEQALAAAATAQQAADADAAAAQTAKEAADAAVARHRATLEEQEQALEATRKASAEADRQAQLLTLADQYAVGGANGSGALAGPVGDCTGGDLSPFPNGRIPLTLLCPVFGAPGRYLRADAAYAFDRLSHAYAAAFGSPICVTSAYRSYDDQVRVAAERPGFAARPGHSNHGWGTALDLCGGIESFGSATHQWMLANAPLFGWFHPAWAEPTGSLPEAWHWEFGG